MRLYRWRPATGENLGDWLSEPILRALGHEPEPPEPAQPVLFGVGTILHPDHYAAAGCSRIVVWGCGASPVIPPDVELDVRAVRGPISRAILGLPDEVPTGDPAVLLPQLVSLPAPSARGEDLYINHISPPAGALPGAMAVSAHVTAETALDLVARIAAARFVASESLHGCILAAAYGIPWAPCSVRWGHLKIDWAAKHNDWLAYLGVHPMCRYTTSLAEARQWWEQYGRLGRIRDTRPLLDAFPQSLSSRGRCIRTSVLPPTKGPRREMKVHLDTGVLVETSVILSIQSFTAATADGKYQGYVRIERERGLSEIHIYVGDPCEKVEAEQLARAKAEGIIEKVKKAM